MEESFLFLFTQLRPHPGPLPKGEGVTYKFLARPVFTLRLTCCESHVRFRLHSFAARS